MEELFQTNKSILTSMIIDEKKLLTYVSIGKELCIHVNSCKILLRRIVEDIRKCNPDQQLNVSYILSGSLKKNTARTVVCSEEDLTEQRKCFESIHFEHIYSVSKGCPNTDNVSLLTVNKYEDFVLCPGLIKGIECDKRTAIEIGNLKSNSQEIILPEKSKSLPVLPKTIKQESVESKNGHEAIAVLKHTERKSEPVIKREELSPKKESVITNKPKVNINGNKTQRGIAGFFNKPNNSINNKKDVKNVQHEQEMKNEFEKNVNIEKVAVENEIPKTFINNINAKKNIQHKLETEKKLENKSKLESTKVEKEKSGHKKICQIKKTSKMDKKRKRVLNVSDSDSENENNDPFEDNSVPLKVESVDSDDEIPPTPSAININIKPELVNPKKKRKLIDKTYTDEDGYILTKKEEVYESCSENEEDTKMEAKDCKENVPKSEISPKAKAGSKKLSPPQKNKQPTLTTFFKRK